MKTTTHSTGGYWMLFGLVVLLMSPLAVTHYARSLAPVAGQQHADASYTNQ